jgi:hypothetical protein
LPDGTIGGFPSWMADPAKSANFTVGPVLTSAAALAELRKLLGSLQSNSQRGNASLKRRREVKSDTRKTPEKTQMNRLFCDSKPMMLPDDKQRELALALADLLLNAATEPTEPDSREDA